MDEHGLIAITGLVCDTPHIKCIIFRNPNIFAVTSMLNKKIFRCGRCPLPEFAIERVQLKGNFITQFVFFMYIVHV